MGVSDQILQPSGMLYTASRVRTVEMNRVAHSSNTLMDASSPASFPRGLTAPPLPVLPEITFQIN